MIKTGDKLLCTDGNDCYVEGKTYTVGSFVNGKYFELLTGCADDHWYATMDDEGIHVRFNIMKDDYSDAWFNQIDNDIYT